MRKFPSLYGIRHSMVHYLVGLLMMGTSTSALFAGVNPSVSLSVASGGNAVSSVASGTVVTLTGSAVSGTTPISVGEVEFCDTVVNTNCSGAAMVGVAQLTSAGAASISVRLGIGSHTLQAVFVGDSMYTAATSAVHSLTVTGKYGSITTISSTAGTKSGTYNLAATVTGLEVEIGSQSPAGTVNFVDTSNGNAVVASMALPVGSSQYGLNFFSAQSPSISFYPNSVVMADLNGDGRLDLITADEGGVGVSVLLGNGDGTFQAQQTYAAGNGPYSVAVGDFNGDGKPDLAVVNQIDDTVSVLLGNGDGTFETQQTYATGSSPSAITVGDFNGDGQLDLAVVNFNDETVSVLLGKGDGTFGTQTTYDVEAGPTSVTVGDFNGDGKLDLAVANSVENTVSVLLGNGDGTFQEEQYFATGNDPYSITVGDFNGDGKLDVAVTNQGDNTLSVLLGNGDGTLQTQETFATGNAPYWITTADFNGDGNPDLAVTNSNDETVSVLLGNGDGTFQARQNYPTGSGAFSVTVGDLNGDGKPDLAVANFNDSTVSPLLNSSGVLAMVTATDISFPPNSGAHLVDAQYAGDKNYKLSTSGTIQIGTGSGPKTTPTITVTPSSSSITTAQPLTVTIAVNGGSGNPTPTGSVILSSGTYTSVAVALSGGGTTIIIPAKSLATGSDTLAVSYTPDSSSSSIYNSASGSAMVTVTASGPAVALSSTHLSFGDQTVGTTSASKQIRLSNTGGAPLIFSSITVTGQDASSFLIENNCGSSLAIGANCTIHGHFAPTVAGTLSAAITITDNASSSPQIAALTGTGRGPKPPAVSFSKNIVRFNPRKVGTSSRMLTQTLTNIGGSPLAIIQVTLTGHDPSSFGFSDDCGPTLAPGAHCTFSEYFKPAKAGALTAAVTISDNTRYTPQKIYLTGTGQKP